ncbi:MAG: DUF4118 domain-containing protein [Magnetococcales bacterium]|nr:DUF4118 domain-containing protein [Magnetococcales bacterium]
MTSLSVAQLPAADPDPSALEAKRDCILVCVGPSPASARLIHAAHRLAGDLRAAWIVVTVDAPDAYPMDDADRQRILDHLCLADSLGAKSLRLSGNRVSDEIIRCAQAHGVSRILVGKPTLRRWRDLVRPSLVYDLICKSGRIDIHFIDGAPVAPSPFLALQVHKPAPWTWHLVGAMLVVLVTLLACLGQHYLLPADLVMIYLLPIMMTAFRYGQRPSLSTAALAVAAYDFFFVPPTFTFTVGDAQHILTFAIMFAVGLVISHLMGRIRRQEQEARQREQQTDALYHLSREIMTLPDDTATAQVITQHAARMFKGDAALFLGNTPENLTLAAATPETFFPTETMLATLHWSCRHATAAGRGTLNPLDGEITVLPLITSHLFGVLAIRTLDPDFFSASQHHLLVAFVQQATLAMDRARLSREAQAAALLAQAEELRNALLSMASHDLRTPLATITGAGTTLRDDTENLDPEQRHELLETICIESERMERLVTNLLDMVRLESGTIHLHREWIPFEELVGSAMVRLEKRYRDGQVTVQVAEDTPLLYVDPVLFEQVLVNLLDNALKYTPPGTPITWTTTSQPEGVRIALHDAGRGIPAGKEEYIFEKFVRGPSAAGIPGSGLGLAICRSIVQAHDGTIRACANPTGGAEFRILLPYPPQPPVSTLEGQEATGLERARCTLGGQETTGPERPT